MESVEKETLSEGDADIKSPKLDNLCVCSYLSFSFVGRSEAHLPSNTL